MAGYLFKENTVEDTYFCPRPTAKVLQVISWVVVVLLLFTLLIYLSGTLFRVDLWFKSGCRPRTIRGLVIAFRNSLKLPLFGRIPILRIWRIWLNNRYKYFIKWTRSKLTDNQLQIFIQSQSYLSKVGNYFPSKQILERNWMKSGDVIEAMMSQQKLEK